MPESPPSRESPVPASLVEQAEQLARRWLVTAAEDGARAPEQRLADLLGHDQGRPFALDFVDGVLRPESSIAAAAHLHRIAADVPPELPWYVRAAVRLGGGLAPVLPVPVIPVARRVLRERAAHVLLDARPTRLTAALARTREVQPSAEGSEGAPPRPRLNLSILGQRVLGDAAAGRRLDELRELVSRPDVDHLSLNVRTVLGRAPGWAFDGAVETAVQRLTPLYLAAESAGTTLHLDTEEHGDLDLTIAVFTRLLDDPRLRGLHAGIALQAYLPDSLAALREITAWARKRVEHGGAPIRVRLVKGGNLAQERVEAAIHGWPPATFDSAEDTDASYLRLLDEALRPGHCDAVRLGVASHDLFLVAYAWLLAEHRGVGAAVEVEMLRGVADAHVRAISADVGSVLLYAPMADPAAFDVAMSQLAPRLAGSIAAVGAVDDDAVRRRQERLRRAVIRANEPAPLLAARRTIDRSAPPHESLRPAPSEPVEDPDLTRAVLSIARGSGSDSFVDTAVYSRREAETPGGGAPGFTNAPASDPALPANREWARQIRERMLPAGAGEAGVGESGAGESGAGEFGADAAESVERTLSRVRTAGEAWGARPAAERADVLLRAAAALEGCRGELIALAASDAGTLFGDADAEVTQAVDFARYYAAKSRELDAIAGAVFIPTPLTLVAPSAASVIAALAGGMLAALAAGSGVVVQPSASARRCALALAEALWQAGVPRDALATVGAGDVRALLAGVDRVIVGGPTDTVAPLRSGGWEAERGAARSVTNAVVIAPSADVDLAVRDLVASAFARAGQAEAAVSLAILVGPMGRSARFARQLADATRSLRVGWPDDLTVQVGPLLHAPEDEGRAAWTALEGDEQWLVRPQPLDGDDTGRLWRPGIRVGVSSGSRAHLEAAPGPVLNVVHVPSLDRAIDVHDGFSGAVVAGLHTRDPEDLALWLERATAGSLVVNAPTLGSVVQRQPIGAGPGAKTGGPNYLVGLGSWRSRSGGAASSTLHLRGLDSRISALIEAAQASLDFEAFEWLRRAALSDAIAWDREFGRVRDVSRLGVERNLLRYHPAPVTIRATGDAVWHELLRVAVAALRSGAEVYLSTPVGLPAAVRRALSDVDTLVAVETDAEWVQRMSGPGRAVAHAPGDASLAPSWPARIRLIGPRGSVAALREVLADAVGEDSGVTVFDGDVTSAGRIELLPFLREQSVTITAHRFGDPDPWSAEVI